MKGYFGKLFLGKTITTYVQMDKSRFSSINKKKNPKKKIIPTSR